MQYPLFPFQRCTVSGDGDFSEDVAAIPLAACAAAILRILLQLSMKASPDSVHLLYPQATSKGLLLKR